MSSELKEVLDDQWRGPEGMAPAEGLMGTKCGFMG